MSDFILPFDFSEDDPGRSSGQLLLNEPLPYPIGNQGSGFYRPGRMILDNQTSIDVALYHNPATAKFIYTHTTRPNPHLLALTGLKPEETQFLQTLVLPGQLIMGSQRSFLISQAIQAMLASPIFQNLFASQQQTQIAVFPIAREGLKYQVTEAIYANCGYLCDEVILDAHHVFDSNVPIFSRKVEMTLFKDKDLNKIQHENITAAFIADSIASGLVMREVINKIKERFPRIQWVEVIAPFATLRGLCRITECDGSENIHIRVHSFETLLNALPPDYYYSAHFNIPELHIRPQMEQAYREWWGQDNAGNWIADTACAGYGWSEVFYSPRKQIEMINEQLTARHNLTIADILRRNLVTSERAVAFVEQAQADQG